MTTNVAIVGTASNHGGQMVSATGTHLQTSGGAACVSGDQHACPIPGHGVTGVTSGCATKATTNGKAVVIKGATAGCGAALVSGFADKITLV